MLVTEKEEYIRDDSSIEYINENLNGILRNNTLVCENPDLIAGEEQYTYFDESDPQKIITQSALIENLKKKTLKYALSKANILITGESGTGKELFAYLIYKTMKQKKNIPFIRINCSAIPENLLETELFGHSKGAFTNALYEKKGKIELAHNGILFLDEIGDMPFAQQSKLLRVIENKELYRVGSNDMIRVDTKIIAATNKDLKQMVKEKQFREDLYFRLNVVHIPIPPLIEHKEDIPLLINYFLKKCAYKEKRPAKYIEDPSVAFLSTLDYPGNIRQLKSIIYRLYISTDDSVITLDDVRECVFNILTDKNLNDDKEENSVIPIEEYIFLEKTKPLKKFKKEIERRYILTQLNKYDGNVSHTARALDLCPSSLFRRIKELGIR